MVENILCLILLYSTFILFGRMSLQDSDYKEIVITRIDKIWFGFYLAVFAVIIVRLPIFPKLYISIALPMLLISAYTDKKLKILYNGVFYILAPLATAFEVIQKRVCGYPVEIGIFDGTLLVIIFVVSLELLHMYGNGDKGMAVVCGCTWYLLRPEYGGAESLLVECIMLLIAEATFYIKAVKEKNLDGPLKLKESRPLGPDLLFATSMVLFAGTII